MHSLVLLTLLSVFGVAVANDLVVCYYSSWAIHRDDAGRFEPENLDPNLCTHAIIGYTGINTRTWSITVLDPYFENCEEDNPEGEHCTFDRFVALKEENPSLKTLVAVGGWNEGSEDYSNMVKDPVKREVFIDSCVALCQKEGFDGLSIDWAYPTQRGGVEEDKENYALLLDEFRTVFDENGLIMTSALASGKDNIDSAYDVESVVRNFDFVSIMTYGYHGAWENFTHHNAPLCGYPSDDGELVYFNVLFTIDYWISLGVPAEMMVMGIPTFGDCFTLDNFENNGMLAATFEPAPPGPYSNEAGTRSWNEICERLQNGSDCTSVLDPSLHEPYMYCESDNLWCGYDDQDSVYLKARFAKNRGLGGVMVWTVDSDDFQSTCGNLNFSLVNAMKDALAVPADPSEPDCPRLPTDITTTITPEPTTTTITPEPTTTTITPKPTTTTITPEPTTTTITAEPTTTSIGTSTATTTAQTTYPSKPDCSEDPSTSYYPHSDCNKYWWCVNDEAILMLCSPGTYFDPNTLRCDFPANADTSHCRVWLCEADGELFAGTECDQYYECEHGEAIQHFCNSGLYYNADTEQCDYPSNVDTSTCNES